jgi:hypothetical protein
MNWKIGLGLLLILALWFFSISGSYYPDPENILKSEASYALSKKDFILSSRCFGFEGNCEFPEYNLKIELSFFGFKIKKPFYNLSLMGGNDGWTTKDYYFGQRRLRITQSNTKKNFVFKQNLWNASGVPDLADTIQFDSAQKFLVIVPKFSISTTNQLVFRIDL